MNQDLKYMENKTKTPNHTALSYLARFTESESPAPESEPGAPFPFLYTREAAALEIICGSRKLRPNTHRSDILWNPEQLSSLMNETDAVNPPFN